MTPHESVMIGRQWPPLAEEIWLSCDNPENLLWEVRFSGVRKLRLYAVACCRRVWGEFKGSWDKVAVEFVEQWVDQPEEKRDQFGFCGAAGWNKLNGKVSHRDFGAWEDKKQAVAQCGSNVMSGDECDAAEWSGYFASRVVSGNLELADPAERLAQADLVRDIFGNPSKPVTFLPEWRTSTVLALAQQMYDSRDFSAMPILADALQDAGCDSDDILDHCRGPGEHVRGCWVVDLVLGKE